MSTYKASGAPISRTERLSAQVVELRQRTKLDSWNQFVNDVKRVLVRPDDYVPKQRKRGWKMRGHDRAGHYRKGTWIAPLKVNGGAQPVYQVKV